MTPRSVLAALVLPALLVASLAAAAVPVLDADQLHPGQKAVVKTVFEGTRIEEFDAEIVAVFRGGRVRGDLILAKATSERVVRSGVAQGMSGSPVYVDGRLIGALSSGWAFSREPLFGVTPIREMLEVLDLPSHPDSMGSAGPAGMEPGAGAVRFGEFQWDEQGDRPPDPRASDAMPATTRALGVPVISGGLHPAAEEPLRAMMAPFGFALTPGGRSARGEPAADSLQPGAAVAVDLMTGDLDLSAIGTLTWRDGDRVLLFGHPLFQAGDVRLPFSTARIATVVANELFSFKLGMRGSPAGTLTQDRRAAMSGRLGPTPGLLPVTVEIALPGRSRERFRFASIEDRMLAPQLVGVAALNSFLESGGGGGGQTLRWTMHLARRGAEPLRVSDVVAADTPTRDLVMAVSAPLRFLYNNPFATLRLDSVWVAIEVAPAREQWTLRSARLLHAAVRPGGTVRVQCEVERWHGSRSTVELALRVPEETPNGKHVLWIGGGPELARYEASRLPARYRPTSLDDAWRRLAQARSGDALYATLFTNAQEVTREGRDYPELPLSALAVMAGELGVGDGGRRGDAARLDERRTAFSGPVHGELMLSVQVDPKAP